MSLSADAEPQGPLQRHQGATGRLGLFEFIRTMRDNVIALYPPYIFDKDYSWRRIGLQPFILINRPDWIHEILVGKPDIYVKGRLNRRILGPALGNGLLTAEGEFWKRQRRIAAPAFHYKRLRVLAEIMVDCTLQTADRWEELADTGRHVDVAREMMRLTMEIVARTLFSRDIAGSIDELGKAVTTLIEGFGRTPLVDMLGLPDWLPRFRDPLAKEALKVLDRMIFDLIETRRAASEPGEDLLQMLLDARDPETGEGMTDAQLRDEIVTLFAAGHETTAQALTWAFYLLDQHPDELDRMVAEVDAILGDRRPTFDDLHHLQRVRMVFEETLRLYPPAFTISRVADTADRLGGELSIPKGAYVSISPYITHRNPRIWPDPERFNPERFADERVAARHKHAYLPFGSGPRICIGSGFALTEGRLILALLSRRFRLRLKHGHPVQPQGIVTLRPRFGMRMSIERR
ncbi:MAG: cytochrome P450 [Pseudomonadota bacterium]|nr:cytochrome P450 [Pseudomonadota bacterium]